MIIDRLLDLLTARGTPAPPRSKDELEMAVAALLIEAARMDDRFEEAERIVIERLLAQRFDLSRDDVDALVGAAEKVISRSAQYFPFTQQICRNMSPQERVQVIEMLWKVAYSDGVLDPHEDMLLRQIAGLIHVTDQERGSARKRALDQLAATTPSSDERG
jgi:uncharacterized tellurite resistance protein B-like protein